MNIFALSGFINGVLFILVGVFVFLKNKKARLNQLFALTCLGGAVWAIPYGFWQMAKTELDALFFLKLLCLGIILAAFFMYCFTLEILNLTKQKKNVFLIFLLGALITIFLIFFTPYLSSGARKLSFYLFWPIGGPVYYFLIAWCYSMVGYSFYLLIRKIKQLTGLERERTRYLLLALIIWTLGMSSNTLQWINNISFPPYGNFIMFLSPLILSFAIFRYHLFEIKVILTELLVGIIGVISLIQAFLAETLRTKLLGFSVFFLFCIIGYLLIKSTHREIKAKEILEERVKARTKELEKNKEELQTAYEDIKQRKEDLEKFYKLTVGRELRMIELKKEIKELEEKLGK